MQSAYPIFVWPEPSEYSNSHPPGDLAPGTLPRFDNLAARYWQKYDKTKSTEWAVLALLFPTPLDHRDTAKDVSAAWLKRTKACAAAPAEYAAFAVTYFDQSGRDIWTGTLPDPTGPFALLPNRLRATEPPFTGQNTLQIQSYFATAIDTFAQTLHDKYRYWATTQINLLSAANLRHLSADLAIPKPIRVNIARVAFLRLLAPRPTPRCRNT